MAGDWIKMRVNLWDDPRVAKLCDMTESSEAAVVGGLYWLWASADQHTTDGVMEGLSLRAIDRKTQILGFGNALCVIGWIFDHPEGVRVARFDEHNGSSAKKRIQTAVRVANFKSKTDEKEEKEESNALCVTKALPVRDLDIEIDKDLKPLSGSPDESTEISPPENPALKNPKSANLESRAVLAHLNKKTGRSYRDVPANLDMISARLKSGVTLEQCLAVIDAKHREWGPDPKMAEFLRPATLFNRTNFEQYLGLLSTAAPQPVSQYREYRPS